MVSLYLYLLLSFLFSWFDTTRAQGDSTLWTSWVPLAVRSPYLSCWMDTTNTPFNASNVNGPSRPPSIWPLFMEGQIFGWAGHIRIDDGFTYKWLGDAAVPGNMNRSVITNIQITPTRTIFNLTAGPIDLVITFLSPIEPADPVLQSLPFSYVSLEATSNDGLSHHVQVYSDISGEWLSGNRGALMNWQTQITDNVIYHQQELESPQTLGEATGQATDATVFYAMQMSPSTTYMADTDANCRTQFQTTGVLMNAINTGPSIINKPFEVLAISVDLGSITATSDPVVWAVGMTRDPAIGYMTSTGTYQQRSPYWASQYSTPQDAVIAFVTDYPNAQQRAVALDQKILSAAANVSTHYADLVSLAARQAMAGTELTVVRSTSDNSQFNTSDVKMFMKDIGASSRVNPVEGMYAAFPFFLYINASYAGYLLEPVLEYGSSSNWANPYAPRDIGTNYPNATGDSSAHNERVEQSGNMLIMSLAHARATGDASLINGYYGVLKTWADYLVNNTLPLSNLQATGDSADIRANLTNLAIKGIIGIKAMSEISAALNNNVDVQHYASISESLLTSWEAGALSTDHQHILANFGDPDSSWGITYNLFADQLLKTGLVNSSMVQMETQFLKAQINASAGGIPIDTNVPTQANSAWSLFTAAYVDDPSLSSELVDQIWGHASSNLSNTGIFPTIYKLDNTNAQISGVASPSIGGVFAPLSLTVPNVTINAPSGSSSSASPPASSSGGSSNANGNQKKSSNVGAIVGGIIGGIGGAALFLIIGFMYWRKSRRAAPPTPEKGVLDLAETAPRPFPYEYTAYQPGSDPTVTTQEVQEVQGVSPGSVPPPIPSKMREHLMYSTAQHQPTPSTSAYTSSTDPASSREPPTVASRSSNSASASAVAVSPLSPSDVIGLRTEVENLRRVMQSLQEDRYEPPPLYDSGSPAPVHEEEPGVV